MALLVAVLAAPVAVAAQRPSASQQVEWLLPVATTHPVQTHAQDEAGKRVGRPLPQPELLQPTLDGSLPLFVPAHGADFHGSIKVGCSDVLPGLVRAWISAFHTFYPRVRVDFGPPYEGTHVAGEMDAGRLDIAFVSRELRPTDVSAFRAHHGYPPLSIPVSGGSYRQFGFLDAVAFFVNRQNPLSHLSLKQLDAVLSRTRLRGGQVTTTWGDLGAKGAWAAQPIHVYAIKPWNGFEEFVRQRVLDTGTQRGHWRKDLHFDPTVFPIAQRVAADPDGIGYAGLAFIDAPVKMLAIGSNGHYVAPTYTNVAMATYPLSRLVYANVNVKPGSSLPPAEREFLRFVLSRQGQQQVLDEAVFLPLRSNQAASARALIGNSVQGEGRP
ncbi:PstS family phosphate ABC transporter substrate-binding protein [Dyella sp. A6]|uniref:PstS family phosphate ABC transporter substrate-binding protein n=1 Tax=Dyella aluminiiresistens TaxID=3069105 RepID=UPI002E7684A1|nr:substrate-binding domain-containing protein [Dyella sp. A6]